jgi:hypothetical protein
VAGYGIYSATQTAAKHGEISDLKKEVKRLGIVKQHFKIYEKANTQNYFGNSQAPQRISGFG